jgi:hypothetical protein
VLPSPPVRARHGVGTSAPSAATAGEELFTQVLRWLGLVAGLRGSRRRWPETEPARAVTQREVGVQHNPVHAVLGAGQQIPIPLSEVISHPPTVELSSVSRQPDCPEGAIPSGRSPGRNVGSSLERTGSHGKEIPGILGGPALAAQPS